MVGLQRSQLGENHENHMIVFFVFQIQGHTVVLFQDFLLSNTKQLLQHRKTFATHTHLSFTGSKQSKHNIHKLNQPSSQPVNPTAAAATHSKSIHQAPSQYKNVQRCRVFIGFILPSSATKPGPAVVVAIVVAVVQGIQRFLYCHVVPSRKLWIPSKYNSNWAATTTVATAAATTRAKVTSLYPSSRCSRYHGR